MAAIKDKNFNFEAALARIETINTQLEGGALTLDDSIKLYEEGVKLVRQCQKALSAAEQKVILLSQNNESA
jgi:exodeoxyribonuclease VII small subunit